MASTRRVSLLLFFFISLMLLLASLQTSMAAHPISFCKCVCGKEKAIKPLPNVEHPIFGGSIKACTSCTKQLCLEDFPTMCEGVGNGQGDEMTTTCFERDSYKDQFVVYLFLTITFGLLAVAGLSPFVKNFMQQRQWGAYSIPGMQ